MKKDELIIAGIFGTIGLGFLLMAICLHSIVAKIIFGILSFLVLAFDAYAICDSIKTSKEKPKDIGELMIEYLKDRSKEPGFAEEMVKNIERGAERRNILSNGQRYEDDDYGYSKNNPIMTSTINTTDRYLEALRTDDNKKFTWNRLGSICLNNLYGVENVMIDEYQLYLDNQEYTQIFICPYGHQSAYAPKGLHLINQ